jgi:hypothetical protein
MANFSITNSSGTLSLGTTQQAMTTSFKTLISMGNSSSTTATAAGTAAQYRRGKLYDILIGTNGTPADNAMEFDVARVTMSTSVATLTVSSLSSNYALDPADLTGCVNQLCINSTTEFTVSVSSAIQAWYIGINQRASYRWVAAPGSEIVWPAVSSASAYGVLALRARSPAYNGTATATVLFQEQ